MKLCISAGWQWELSVCQWRWRSHAEGNWASCVWEAASARIEIVFHTQLCYWTPVTAVYRFPDHFTGSPRDTYLRDTRTVTLAWDIHLPYGKCTGLFSHVLSSVTLDPVDCTWMYFHENKQLKQAYAVVLDACPCESLHRVYSSQLWVYILPFSKNFRGKLRIMRWKNQLPFLFFTPWHTKVITTLVKIKVWFN